MRFFISTEPDRNLQGDNPRYRITQAYVEMEVEIEGYYVVFYIVPRNDHSAFILTCWDFTFDEVASQLDDPDYAEVVAETWKTFSQVLVNGMNDRYSQGALIRSEDFDTGESKWFLASVAGNLDFSSIDILLSEDTQSVIDFVITQSITLMQELNEKQPSQWKRLAKGASRGFWRGVGYVAAGSLVALLGGDPSQILEGSDY